jgi:hypothetical protein
VTEEVLAEEVAPVEPVTEVVAEVETDMMAEEIAPVEAVATEETAPVEETTEEAECLGKRVLEETPEEAEVEPEVTKKLEA